VTTQQDRAERGLRVLVDGECVAIHRAHVCIGATRFCLTRNRDGSVTFGVEGKGLDNLLAISEAFAMLAKTAKKEGT